MDIRNLIRIQAQVDMAQMTAGARHLDRYTAAIDRHNVAMRRLGQSSGAERVLQGIASAAVAASNQTQAAMIRMRGGIQAALAHLSTIAGPARAGFSSIVAAAEGAARRTAAAFQRLRIALPRSGIEAFQRTLGQLPAFARTAVSRTNAALTRLHLAAFRVLDPFAGLPAFARRAVVSTNAILASLRLPRFLTGDPFRGLISSAQRTARGVQDAFARLRALRLPTFRLPALSLPRLGLEGLQRTLGTLPTIARAAVTRTNAALSALRLRVPAPNLDALTGPLQRLTATAKAQFSQLPLLAQRAVAGVSSALGRLRGVVPSVGFDAIRRSLASLAPAARTAFGALSQAATTAVARTTAALRGLQLATLSRTLERLPALASTAFNALPAAASAAVARTNATLRNLRVALPRVGIEAFERTLGQLPAFARSAVSRTNAVLTGLRLAAFRVLDPFAGLAAFARRAVSASNLALSALRSPRQLVGDPFRGLATAASAAVTRTNAALRGLRITLPRIGIEAWQRGFSAVNGTLQATVGRVATFGRSMLGLNRQIAHGNVLVEGWGLVHAGAAAQLARHNVAVSRNETLTQRLAAVYRTVGAAGTSMGAAVGQAGAAMGRGIQAGAAMAGRGFAVLERGLLRLQLAPLTAGAALDRFHRELVILGGALAHTAARGGPVARAFAALGSQLYGVARGTHQAALHVRDYGVASAAAVATTNLLRAAMNGLAASAAAVARSAANAARGLVSGLSGGAIGGPPAGGGAAAAGAAGGWGAVGRAATLAGVAMRQAGLLGVRALQTIAGAAATAAGAISSLTANLSIALGAVAFVATSVGARFEQALNKVTALTNVVADQFGGNLSAATKGLTADILALTRTIPRTPDDLAAGLYFILSAGIRDAADAFKILKVSAEAAVAGNTEVRVVADAVTSALLAYNLPADKARSITDALTQAVIEGKTEFDTFAQSIGRVLPAAANLGVTFAEVSASLAVLTRVGLNSEEAATSIRAMFLNLTAAAPETKDALDSIGLSISDVQKAIKERGFLAVVNELYDAFGGNIEQLDKIIPNIRALTGFLVLGGSGAQVAAEAYERVRNASAGAGRTAESFATAMTTLINKLGLLRNSLINIGILIFVHLQEPLKAAVDRLTAFFFSISDWIMANEELAGSIVRVTGAFTALALIAFGLPKILQAASLFFGLFGAFGLTTVRARQSFAAFGTVLKVIAPIFVLLAAAAIGLGHAFDVQLGAGVDRAQTAFGRLLASSGEVLGGVKSLFSGIINILRQPVGAGGGMQADLEQRFVTPLQRIRDFVGTWQEDHRTGWLIFLSNLRGVGGTIGRVFSNIGQQLEGPLANIISIVRELAPSVLPALGAFATSAVEAGAGFIDGLVRGFIAALPTLEQIRARLFDWIAETAPVIAGRLEQWSSAFLAWVADVGPGLVSGLASWVGDGLARILELLGAWLPAIARWVVTDFIPGVFDALRGLVDGLIHGLTEGRIIQRLTASLVEGIITITPQLIAALAVVIGHLVAFLVTEGPRLAFVLVTGFVEGFLEGIRRVFDDLISPMRELSAMIMFALVPAFLRLTAVMTATALRGALLLIAPLVSLTRVALALAAAIAGRVVMAFSMWRAEMVGVGIASASLGFARMIGGLLGFVRSARVATGAMTALQTVTHLQGLAAQQATGSLLAAGTAATVAGGGFAGATTRLGRFAGRLGLGGVISSLGRLGAFLPGVGMAVLAFTIAYETNFLGLRDVTDDVVGWIIDRLGDLGDSFVDILRDLHLLDEWAASQGGSRAEIDALGASYRELQEVLRDVAGATAGGDVGAGVLTGTTLPDIDALVERIAALGRQYNVTADEAIAAFVRIARARPSGTIESWLADTERGFQGLATSVQDTFTLIREGPGVGNWLAAIPAFQRFKGFLAGVRHDLQHIADQEALDEAAQAVEDWVNRTNDALLGMGDELQTSVRQAQELLSGTHWTIPDLDLSGFTRQEQIDKLTAYLAQIPKATSDMTGAQKLVLRLLVEDTNTELLKLTNGLDLIAESSGVHIDTILTEFQRLTELRGLSPEAAVAAILELIKGGWGAGPQLPITFTPVLPPDAAVVAAKWNTQIARFGEELGFGAIKVGVDFIPNTAMAPIDVSGIGAGAGTQISEDLKATAPLMGIAASALAKQVRGILAISSEPQSASSPLRGITTWGFNMVRTIATGMQAGRALVALAVSSIAGLVAKPFLVLMPAAFTWGLGTGLSYAAGLRAAGPAIAGAAKAATFSVVKLLKAGSPPGADSPLHHIMDWGRATMEAFADGISAARGRVLEATRSVVDVAASTLSKSRLPELNIGASGVFTATSALTPMRLAPDGGADARLGPDPAVPELLATLINEQRLNNQLLARVAANDPNASGALPARGTLDQLRFVQRRS